ncbi:phage tail protein [Yersinia intermedia]|uniref:phage tail protein n=1 Tax=Yersinia intermedia TaxID=631 RepID=UPI001CFCAD89|nr:phage tail protein [Yersinia intermedia]MCB5311907.1 phage tail protein [Yersinia intermedia]MCB5325368.1 phage tail protein [Yersinia intermedia]
MTDPVIKSPSEYAKIAAGTRVSYGPKGVLLTAAKLLQSAMAIGATGKKGTFIKLTRLIDTEPKYMADMGEGEDKTFVFIDDPDDANQTALLADAKSNKTVVFFMQFPNGRVAEVEIVLSGWSLQAVDSPEGKVLQVEVYGKQNGVKWSSSVVVPEQE